jgi:hypothetical protein
MKLTPHQEAALLFLWREHLRTGELWFDARSRQLSLPTVYTLKAKGLVEARSEMVTVRDTPRGHMIIGRRCRTICVVEVRLTQRVLRLFLDKWHETGVYLNQSNDRTKTNESND